MYVIRNAKLWRLLRSVLTGVAYSQLNITDNSIGDEGAAALARHWKSGHVCTVLRAVAPGFPDTDLFVNAEAVDKAIVDGYGFSKLRDHRPGRSRR